MEGRASKGHGQPASCHSPVRCAPREREPESAWRRLNRRSLEPAKISISRAQLRLTTATPLQNRRATTAAVTTSTYNDSRVAPRAQTRARTFRDTASIVPRDLYFSDRNLTSAYTSTSDLPHSDAILTCCGRGPALGDQELAIS
eukprot:3308645-Prymnesium_polylepis.1